MHELAVVQSVVEEIVAKLGEAPIAKVRLAIGTQSGVVVDAVRFAFDLMADGTSMHAAELVVDEPVGRDLRIVSVEVWRTCVAPAAAPTTE